jgi:phospholipid transport system substrate-binding protein
MHQRNGSWAATDIVVEGISLSENYRDQFRSLLRTRSFDELLELLRRKLRRYRAGDAE